MTFFEEIGFGDGSTTSSSISNSTAMISFDDDGTFLVNTGCNTGSGTYGISDAQLIMDTTVKTDAYCSDDVQEKEVIFYTSSTKIQAT